MRVHVFALTILVVVCVPAGLHAGQTDLLWYVCDPQGNKAYCYDNDGPTTNGLVSVSTYGMCENSKIPSANAGVQVIGCQNPVLIEAITSVSLSTAVDNVGAFECL